MTRTFGEFIESVLTRQPYSSMEPTTLRVAAHRQVRHTSGLRQS